MKKTLLLIIPLFFLFVGCDDDTPTNGDDGDVMMSLDWILLKKGVDTEFYVESCDGYDNCGCDISSECGECYWETKDGDDYYLYEYKLYWTNTQNTKPSNCPTNLLDKHHIHWFVGQMNLFFLDRSKKNTYRSK